MTKSINGNVANAEATFLRTRLDGGNGIRDDIRLET